MLFLILILIIQNFYTQQYQKATKLTIAINTFVFFVYSFLSKCLSKRSHFLFCICTNSLRSRLPSSCDSLMAFSASNLRPSAWRTSAGNAIKPIRSVCFGFLFIWGICRGSSSGSSSLALGPGVGSIRRAGGNKGKVVAGIENGCWIVLRIESMGMTVGFAVTPP